MSAPKSTHIPEVAHGIAAVTGTLIVETDLRDIQTAVATLKATAIAANEESHAIVTWSGSKLTIKVYKGGTASGTIGDSAVNVCWMAIGQ